MDTTINSATTLFALLGYPVNHSISPVIHNSLFAGRNLNCRYMLLKIPPANLGEAVAVLRANFGGFNVTVPYKQAIMSYLDEIDDKARLYGSVNTVKNVNGRLIGYNTDGYGFVKAFERLGIPVAGKNVLMLGAGGGARSVLYELMERCCHVTIINRSTANAEKLKREFSGQLPGIVEVGNWSKLKNSYQFLINTTPVGMHPENEKSPVEAEMFARHKCKVVYDLIYNPATTKLLADAKRHGCIAINGYPMLFYQALEANRIWTGVPITDDVAEQLYIETEQYLSASQRER